MARIPPPIPGVKVVWRISVDSPMGEYIDRTAPKTKPSPLPQPEVVHGSWVESSFDLLHGTLVEHDPNTLSPELLDALFGDGEAWADTRPFPYP